MNRRRQPKRSANQQRGSVPRRTSGRRLKTYVARHLQNLVGTMGRIASHPFSSAMTIAVIGIALALPAGLNVLVKNGKALSGGWESAVDMSLYLKQDVLPEQAERLARIINAREEVVRVELITAEDALDEFRRHSGFGSALDSLAVNPLPTVLVIRPAPGHDSPEAIESLGNVLALMPESDLVQMDTQWVSRFQAILEVIRRAVAVAGVLLAIGVIIIIGNTIRLDIQNRHAEIEVTKLVGGTDGFIRRPFLYSGFWYGVIGGSTAVGLVELTLLLLADPVQRIAGMYGSQFELLSLGYREMSIVVLGGALLGLLGSWLAATRHLRRIEPR